MTEDELLRNIIKLARLLGVHTAHFRPALTKTGRWVTPVQGDGKGWLDLTLIGPGGGKFRELKAEGKYPTPEQKQWMGWLREAGFDADWWRPRDWTSGRIEHELRAIAKPIHQLTEGARRG